MQNHSAPLQELSGIFYSSPNLNTQSKRYPQAIKAIKLSSIKLNSPLHSYLIVLGVSRAAVLGSCGSCSRVWVSHQLCCAFGSLAPTAVPRGCFWCCQLDWAIPNGSCVPNKNEFCICLGSCPGRGRGGGSASARSPQLCACTWPNTHLQRKGDICKPPDTSKSLLQKVYLHSSALWHWFSIPVTSDTPAQSRWLIMGYEELLWFLAKPLSPHFNHSFPICKALFQHDASRQLQFSSGTTQVCARGV